MPLPSAAEEDEILNPPPTSAVAASVARDSRRMRRQGGGDLGITKNRSFDVGCGGGRRSSVSSRVNGGHYRSFRDTGKAEWGQWIEGADLPLLEKFVGGG
ncbi:hypothetical protein HPP92_015764 [Vanilla planifolia]|uniref:Uncharacterized protein n=1 Tax=Vanilla planifolia TaxID=51239 RepID=A0A835URG1_VANPL|nr:hypothetical protein HPP92_015764 [Vanilla planifolia]